MTDEEYKDLKEVYVKHIKNYIKETGGLFPHVTILADHLDKTENPTNAIIHIPIPDEFMEDAEGKDEFVDEVLPQIMKTVKEKFMPHGIAWASEAWMRTADKDFNFENEDYRELPKTEVIFMSIESENKTETYIYEVVRKGMKVGEDGDLSDNVDLVELKDMFNPDKAQGRFSGLYKKLINF